MIFLEDYIDAVESISPSVQNMLSTLRELNAQVHVKHEELIADMSKFASKAAIMRPQERTRILCSISDLLHECVGINEDRALVSMSTKDIVKNHVARANDDYLQFCEELAIEEAKLERKRVVIEANAAVAAQQSVYAEDSPAKSRRQGPSSSEPTRDRSVNFNARREKTPQATGYSHPRQQVNPDDPPAKRRAINPSVAPPATSTISSYEHSGAKSYFASSISGSISSFQVESSTKSIPSGSNIIQGRPNPSMATSKPQDLAQEQLAADIDTPEDADEDEYCYCRKGTWVGDMVGCDDEQCVYEWFHLQCVGLKVAPPEGEPWICPECLSRREKERLLNKRKKRSKE